MATKRVSLTAAGKKKLEEELEELLRQRPEITERIATARDFGDLKENEEYSAARNEKRVAEDRILEIQEILKNAQVIRGGKRSKVALGATVEFKMDGKPKKYTVVGTVEADPSKNMISNESPIGTLLMGKKVGDEFDFNGRKVKVVAIE